MLLSDVLECIQEGKIIKDGYYDYLDNCTSIKNGEGKVLTFIEDVKYIGYLENSTISCVICTSDIVGKIPCHIDGIVVHNNPKYLFYLIHNNTRKKYIPTQIGKNTKISKLASISEYNVVIGNNVIIDDFVVIKENVTIEDNCKVHAGTIIGAKSFVVISNNNESFVANDLGKVYINKNCEILSNCNIACGTLESDTTEIGEYTTIDALVHIGHGTKIGKRCKIPAGVNISGNVVVGNDSWIGVNATISNRIKIGNNSRISLGSVVTKDVEENTTVSGNFAIDHNVFINNIKKIVNSK